MILGMLYFHLLAEGSDMDFIMLSQENKYTERKTSVDPQFKYRRNLGGKLQ